MCEHCPQCQERERIEADERRVYAQQREDDRVPMTTAEHLLIGRHMEDARIIEKFRHHWEWDLIASSGTGPTLEGVLDHMTDADDEP